MNRLTSSNKTIVATKMAAFALLASMLLLGIFAIFPAIPASAAAAGPGTYKVTTSAGLNVRSGPGTGYGRVGGINYGATFEVTQTSGAWGYVPAKNGWASLDYAQLVQAAPTSMTSSNLPNGYYVISSKFDFCKVIDIYCAYGENGTCAIIYDWNGTDNQIFYFERLSDGTYRIQAKHSGRYLEVRNSSHSNGAEVAQWDWHDSYACKRWYVIDCGDGCYKLINKESGKALDLNGGNTSNGTRIQQYQENGTNAQRFRLTNVSAAFSNPPASNDSTSSWQYPLKGAYCSWRGYSNSTWSWGEDRYGNSSSSSRNFHLGLDLNGSSSTVYAALEGTVAAYSTSNSGANGRYVILKHSVGGQTVYSFYAHLSSVKVSSVGQSVNKNTEIGVVGGSGNGSNSNYGEHLHFAIVDTLWKSGGYYGYATKFSGNAKCYEGVTYYNPKYVIDNNRLP